jgi:hypothetical protein
MPDQESSWPGLPRLALGLAVLAAEQLRLIQRGLRTPAADPASPTLTGSPASSSHSPAGPTLPDGTIMPEGPTPPIGFAGPVEVSPADGVTVPPVAASPYAVAVGLAQHGADLAQQGAELAQHGVARGRAAGDRVLKAARSRASRAGVDSPVERARGVVGTAGVRGQHTIDASRTAALGVLRSAVNGGVTWAETTIVPRMVDDLMPYLISSVVPRLVEGALPEIRTKVLPVVIDDLTTDARVRALVTEQGRSILTDASEELRSTSASADDAVETSFRKLFHLNQNGER